jgi:hypothetical protein
MKGTLKQFRSVSLYFADSGKAIDLGSAFCDGGCVPAYTVGLQNPLFPSTLFREGCPLHFSLI